MRLQEFRIIEFVEDDYDSDFGHEKFENTPAPGDVVDLHRSDGRVAYPVTVIKVDKDRMRIWVKQ